MILGPTARPYVSLGGEFAHSVRRRGELVQSFQYVNTEPAMIIWSATRKAGAFAICLSVAHEYLDDRYLVFQAMSAAMQIGYSPKDRSVVGKIADLILDGLDELVRMPPEPTAAVSRREQRTEVLLREGGPDGHIVSHQELLHDPLEQMQ
jgi:hypothetical protein